uniref:Uncharacterized protein n=1 Tax=Setaria italica TaxID=4555 RepID=K4ANG0_SETIT
MCIWMGKVYVWISSGNHRVCRSNHCSKLSKVLLQFGSPLLFPLKNSNI